MTKPPTPSNVAESAVELLEGVKLAERVRQICAGDGVRLAVAFWGRGAAANLFSSPAHARRARILCDVTLGGTRETALRELGAPDNKRLRHIRALHAKLYLSDRGLVLGSANASSAALGFDGSAPHHVELGTYHPPAGDLWRAARKWFDTRYKPAPQVDDNALERARKSFRPPPPDIDAHPGSLVDAVRLDPNRFRGVAFFCEKIPLLEADARAERKASKTAATSRKERDIIDACSHNDIFASLTDAEVRDTPPYLIEFWQPAGRKLRVFARRVEHRDRKNGTLYTSRNARVVAGHIPGGLPSLTAAARSDAAAIHAILAKRQGGVRFLGPDALIAALPPP